jgi:transglutaminase-like putative cysteine protease
MRLFIHHRTDYRFSEPQARLVQLLRLTPTSHEGQNVVDWRIDVDCDARLKPGHDGYGNETCMLYVDGPIEHISLTVSGEVLTEDRAGVVIGAPEPLPPQLFTQTTRLTRPGASILDLARGIEAGGGSPLDRAHRLNHEIYERMRFSTAQADVDRTACDAFDAGEGVGQDFAHIFISAARSMGLPARYVSGHVYRRGAEASRQSASHGWAEAYIADYGWIGFDPTDDICPHDAYVRVAIGLDYHDAAPVSGARTGGGREMLDVGVRVGLSQVQTQG